MFEIFRKLFSHRKEDVDKTKEKFALDMYVIHAKAKQQVQSSQELVRCIENSIAYKIALATGRLKK
jgi:hypothetical protein